MVFPNVCFCYIRANGGKKRAESTKNTPNAVFIIDKMTKFIENIKILSAELKSVSQKSCAYIIASIYPLGYLKLIVNMQNSQWPIFSKKTLKNDPMP